MEFLQSFPIAIIDEDFNGFDAAGRGMRQLATAIEREGFRVVSGIGYEDARRLATVFNNESCWLISVDGARDADAWKSLEATLTKKRQRNDRLPIFLFGNEFTAEMVPAAVLRHANAFMRLYEDSPEFLARTITRSAQLYLQRIAPPMFRALMEYTLGASYSWHTPGHGGGVGFRKSPVGQLFYSFFGENTVRSDISVSVGALGSLLDHTGPIAEGERNAARIFGADHTLFVVGGTSTANKIVWHGMVGRGDYVLCDRNCHKSILHSLVMTGATPIYLIPSRNGLGIIGPISREQFAPAAIAAQLRQRRESHSTPAGKVRLMVLTNSTYDGLCYNVDAIKETLGDSIEVLHFDEAWYAYANFHEFYDGYHAIASRQPTRARRAITFATQSTHKLLAALSQASMLHVLNAEERKLDLARFNESFMMHTSTSPQYGIIASCDVAAAMMESPGGRAIVQETLDEALAFRRALHAAGAQLGGSWWFRVWQPDEMTEKPTVKRSDWVLKPGDAWHGFEELAEEHVLLDPIKVTILAPGLSAQGQIQEQGIPAVIVTKFLSSRRIEIEKTGLYSFLVLFSMGITKGKWSTLIAELINFRDLYEANAPLSRALPALCEAHPEAYGAMGLKDLCAAMHIEYCERNFAQAQHDMYTTLPEMRMTPSDAYNALIRGGVESVEIDELMGRTVAVMLVPYPPGIPVIMPGERITEATRAIQDYLLHARAFDRLFPGFETDIHGLRFDAAADGSRRYLLDCVAHAAH